MGYKIAVVQQKGGVAKSTTCRNLAVAYSGFGWDVKIADLDVNQSTSFTWHKRRIAAGIEPNVAVEIFGSATLALKQAEKYDVFIFDGAPMANRATLEVSLASDLVVIPTGLGLDDMEPCVILANDLVKNGVDKNKIAFVFCRTTGSDAELQYAYDYMSQTPYFTVGSPLPEKPSIRAAHDAGLAAIECKFKGPREAAEQVTQALINRLDELVSQS